MRRRGPIVRQVPVYRVRPNVQYVPVDTYPVTSAYLPYPEESGGGLFGGGMGGILGALLPIMLEQMVGGGGGGLGGLGGLLGESGGFAGDSLDFANPGGASFTGLGPSYADPYAVSNVGYGYDNGGYGYGYGDQFAGGGGLGDSIGSIFGSGLLGGGLGNGLLGDPLGGFDLDGVPAAYGGIGPQYGYGPGYADAGGLDAVSLVTQLLG